MKTFDRILMAVFAGVVLLMAGANIVLWHRGKTDGARPYRVEIYRIAAWMERDGVDAVSLLGCEYVTGVEMVGDGKGGYGEKTEEDTKESEKRKISFDYTADVGVGRGRDFAVLNAVMGMMALFLFAVLLFVRQKILRPFEKLSDVPCQLSRGMLTMPLKENKNHFFGRFIWGMDLLREIMEEQKKRTLELQRDRDTMLLSLSHDIKTPLLAMKLYAKALEKGIYSGEEKQLEVAENIGKKADEIEAYLTQMTGALREDFLSLTVQEGEFYLSVLVQEIKQHYRERLALLGTEFAIGEYTDCLVRGDFDRSVEVLQNLMENAIKYGDGKRVCFLFSQEENCVLVTVKNSGCTLSAAELPHIFESFWRGSNVGDIPGSGLGLFICRRLMHRMKGEVFAALQEDGLAVTAVFCKVS